MSGVESDITKTLHDIFEQAKTKGGISYIYTLLRVTGISREIDPLIRIMNAIKKIDEGEMNDDAFVKEYRSLLDIEDPFNILINLTNCIKGLPYDLKPFSFFNKDQSQSIVVPDIQHRIKCMLERCKETGQMELEKALSNTFPENLTKLVMKEKLTSSEVQFFKSTYENVKEFLNILIELQHKAGLEFLNQTKLYKLPRFEVLELLCSPDVGLYGFKMHFSNGTSARFERTSEETECVNLILERPINFWVGSIDELKHEWRVGKKRLYEIGLPGRYNKLGEWKPLIYPGSTDSLQSEVVSLSKDPRVQGSIFYMMCTGHRVMEFVIFSTLYLPIGHATLGNKIHLWKCPPLDEEKYFHHNIHIYDGWIELDTPDAEHIKVAIDSIGITANRLAFTYGASVKWCVKYNMVYSGGGYASPTENDLEILNDSLKNFPINEDAMVLDSAIDWFNHGKNSTNIFTRFLCYYIALESITIAITDGKADFGLGYNRQSRDNIQEEKKKCIEEKYNRLFKEDPIKFVRDAYFECHESLKSKTRQVVNLVFGQNHDYIQKLFSKERGWSLSDIRGALAHGELSYLDDNHRELVTERIYDIELITRDLIHRLNFRLKPEDNMPSWSNRHAMSCSTADPRMTLVVSDEKIIPNKDWRIRADWCE